jgi:tetratricopeptide (TPR) repeat protein
VIAHATARTFDAESDVREVGDLLGVRYVLSGNIERSGEALRLTAELASSETGEVLWAERLVPRQGRLADARDEIVGRIATTLNFRLTLIESERGRNERPDNPAASDLTSRGWSLVYSGKKPAHYAVAREHFREAIERDPRNANAMAGVGWTSAVMVLQGWSHAPSDDIAAASEAADRALAIEPDHVVALHVRGFLFRLQRRPDAAREAFRAVIALNPNFAPGHAQLAVADLELGHPEAVLPSVEKAMRLSPRDPSLGPWLAFVGMANLHSGNPAEAVVWLERSIDTGTPVALHRAYLASALALTGRRSEAADSVSALLREKSSITIASLRASARSGDPTFLTQRERLFDGLRLAGLPEA